MPRVSIVMTTFNRPLLLATTLLTLFKQAFTDFEVIVVDDGIDEKTPSICKALQVDGYPVNYVKLNRPLSAAYRNQARPLNVGLRQATGDIIILQNAECRHMDEDVIETLVQAVTDMNVVFARITAMNEDGTPWMVYCGKENQRPYFFCGAIKRSWFEKLRGFDEDYEGYGYEDDDFADRLRREGLTWTFTDAEVQHQWHAHAGGIDMSRSSATYNVKTAAMSAGTLGTIRNLTREWGAL